MPLLASWEVLAIDEIGPGGQPGQRRFHIWTIATTTDGDLQPVNVTRDVAPEVMVRWAAARGHGKVTP